MTDLTNLAEGIYQANKEKGFWDRPRPLTETTMLIVTELAEAVEEDRAGREGVYYLSKSTGGTFYPEEVFGDRTSDLVLAHPSSTEPLKPEGVDVELIDALIRLLDLLGSRGTDVDELLRQKLAYNATRGVRHGKSY